MGWLITDLNCPCPNYPPSIVDAQTATEPIDTGNFDSGDSVILPVPSGIQKGDLMLALVDFDDGTTGSYVSIPAGWSNIYYGTDGGARS